MRYNRFRSFENNNRNAYKRRIESDSPYVRTPLDVTEVKVGELSTKYNIQANVIAYIRAAMKTGKYTMKTLEEHILFENRRRVQAIQDHHKDKTKSFEERKRIIQYTTNNLNLRKTVLLVMKRLTINEFNDIVKY